MPVDVVISVLLLLAYSVQRRGRGDTPRRAERPSGRSVAAASLISAAGGARMLAASGCGSTCEALIRSEAPGILGGVCQTLMRPILAAGKFKILGASKTEGQALINIEID
ncbi:MAG: hypothetical protein WA294_11330 [Acidobacteriaceae bacterium]